MTLFVVSLLAGDGDDGQAVGLKVEDVWTRPAFGLAAAVNE